MLRVFLTCVLLAACTQAVATEPASSTTDTRYTVKFKLLRVEGEQATTIEREVTGVRGTPLKCKFNGPNGLVLNLDVRDEANSQPPLRTQPTTYIAELKLVEATNDSEQRVLSQPKVATVAGCPAKLLVGDKKGDRVELDLIIKEGMAGATKSQAVVQDATNSKKQKYFPSTTYGMSLMKMVDPRALIQEEEELIEDVVPPRGSCPRE